MSRIFTFGCSFTSYRWPTWADIILYGNEGCNFGVSGGGFDSILYRMMESDRRYVFTPKDKIIVVFTTPIRWDMIIDHRWTQYGQILNNTELNKHEGKLYTIEGLVFKSFYNIQLIKDYLEHRNLNYVFGSVNDLYKNLGNFFETVDVTNETNKLISHIKNNVEIKLIDFKTYMGNGKESWEVSKYFKDYNSEYHPRPITYFNWVNDVLVKHMDIKINVSENQIFEIEKHIDSLVYFEELDNMYKVFPEFYRKKKNDSIYFRDVI